MRDTWCADYLGLVCGGVGLVGLAVFWYYQFRDVLSSYFLVVLQYSLWLVGVGDFRVWSGWGSMVGCEFGLLALLWDGCFLVIGLVGGCFTRGRGFASWLILFDTGCVGLGLILCFVCCFSVV